MVEEGSGDYKRIKANDGLIEDPIKLKEYLMDNFSEDERKRIKNPKYFYEITFEKPGGLVMPLIVEYTYEDGSKETITYPAEIWRKNDTNVKKAMSSEKAITKIVIDPNEETADIDTSNNSWPGRKRLGKFQQFKNKIKGQ